MKRNDRQRQLRRQRRAAKRRQVEGREKPSPSPSPFRDSRLADEAIRHERDFLVVNVAERLLGGAGPLPQTMRPQILGDATRLSTSQRQLLARLEAFLYQRQPWSLSVPEVAIWRNAFSRFDDEAYFERLLCLAQAASSATIDESRLDTAARIPFALLRLLAPGAAKSRPKGTAKQLADQFVAAGLSHEEGRTVAGFVLRAVALVGIDGADLLLNETVDFAEERQASLESQGAWRAAALFLRELFVRATQRDERGVHWLSQHRRHLDRLTTFVHPPDDELAAADLKRSHNEIGRLMHSYLDDERPSYGDRLRRFFVEIRVISAAARSGHPATEDKAMGEATVALLEGVIAFATRGVPEDARAVAQRARAAIPALFVRAVSATDAYRAAFPLARQLLQNNPRDFRLACIDAVGAMIRRETPPQSNDRLVEGFDPDFLARTVVAAKREESFSADLLRKYLVLRLRTEEQRQALQTMALRAVLSGPTERRHSSDQVTLSEIDQIFGAEELVLGPWRRGEAMDRRLVFLAQLCLWANRPGLEDNWKANEIRTVVGGAGDVIQQIKTVHWVGAIMAVRLEKFLLARGDLGVVEAATEACPDSLLPALGPVLHGYLEPLARTDSPAREEVMRVLGILVRRLPSLAKRKAAKTKKARSRPTRRSPPRPREGFWNDHFS